MEHTNMSMNCKYFNTHECFYAPCVCTCHETKEMPVEKKVAIIRVTKSSSTYYVTVEYNATGIEVGEYYSLRAAADYADRHLQLVSNMFGIRAEIVLGSE